MTAKAHTLRERFSFSSSIAADVWSPKPNAKAYEWWYFDALSDDGRDAVVIIFLDNFIFSPRYNRAAQNGAPDAAARVPAIAFFYYRDGRPLYRAINEYRPEEFSASATEPACTLGANSFRFDSAPYGRGYVIAVDALLSGGRRLAAQFEWVAIESDFTPGAPANIDETHNWNLVAPRADVSGRVTVESRAGRETDVIHFRGTGYHDHNYDNRWLPEVVRDWQWGRAHFNDATAVFYRFTENDAEEPVTRLFTIRGGALRADAAEYAEEDFARDIFGVRYPRLMTFAAADGTTLRVRQSRVIDSSFFYLRYLAEMTLTMPGGESHTATGITEYLNPKTLRYRWLDWMVTMRIGRGGRGARIK